jgi:hypothetical protein
MGGYSSTPAANFSQILEETNQAQLAAAQIQQMQQMGPLQAQQLQQENAIRAQQMKDQAAWTRSMQAGTPGADTGAAPQANPPQPAPSGPAGQAGNLQLKNPFQQQNPLSQTDTDAWTSGLAKTFGPNATGKQPDTSSLPDGAPDLGPKMDNMSAEYFKAGGSAQGYFANMKAWDDYQKGLVSRGCGFLRKRSAFLTESDH